MSEAEQEPEAELETKTEMEMENEMGIGIRKYRFLHRKTKTQTEIKSLPARKNEITAGIGNRVRTEDRIASRGKTCPYAPKNDYGPFLRDAQKNEYGPVFVNVCNIDNGKQYILCSIPS